MTRTDAMAFLLLVIMPLGMGVLAFTLEDAIPMDIDLRLHELQKENETLKLQLKRKEQDVLKCLDVINKTRGDS
jgi:hypothetical protein